MIPAIYKVFSRALCNRIIPRVSNEIDFWQRAFLSKRNRQELIFSLKSSLDDFRHLSTKFYLVFIDFADPFGSVSHNFIFQTLEHFQIPLVYCCLIEDLYKYSSFRIICGYELTQEFFIIRGTKTGDPLSAILFILVIDRICKPMMSSALITLNLENEHRFNPLPV